MINDNTSIFKGNLLVSEIVNDVIKKLLDYPFIIHDNDKLFEIGLDSQSMLRLIVNLEERLYITFRDEHLIYGNFSTVGSILRVIGLYI
nr:acyl carrier protein [Paenibacillus xylanexedens]